METQNKIIQFQYEINIIQTIIQNKLKQLQQTIIDYEQKKENCLNNQRKSLSFDRDNQTEMKRLMNDFDENANANEMIQMILQTEESVQNEFKSMKTKIEEFYENCKNHNDKMIERNNDLIDEMITIQNEIKTNEMKGTRGKVRKEIEKKYDNNINELKSKKKVIVRQSSESSSECRMNSINQYNSFSNSPQRNRRDVARTQIQEDEVQLKVVTQDSTTAFFKIKRTTPMMKLMEAFCNKQGLAMGAVRFICNEGVRITPDKTPNDLGLQDGDVIDAMMNQCGGKPVILLYNENEVVEQKEVSVKLTLNEAMNIGATYPNPSVSNEKDEKKKEYEWKGVYSSNGNEKACQITMNNKKLDYVFWEGPCMKEEQFNGEVIGIRSENFEEELDLLLEKLGLNERERNDFIVYWLTKLSGRKGHKVTICDDKYDNEIAQLEVSGFNKQLRVMLKFEEINENEVSFLKGVDSVEKKERPTGKYVIEWGAILA